MSKYISRKITESQKAAAHDFYRGTAETGDVPKSDLASIYGAAAAATTTDAATDLDTHEEMAGRLHERGAILDYVRAGNATVTVVSRRTGTRFTFKFQRPKDWEPGPQRPVAPVFCKVLTGADNESSFEFVGTMWPEESMFPDGPQVYRHGKNARISPQAPSVKALVWLVRTALDPRCGDMLERCEVWHEGRCGRCGRKLTVPSSIESGYGPECIGKVGL